MSSTKRKGDKKMDSRLVYTAIAVVLIAGCLVLIVTKGSKKGGSNQVESDRISFDGETIDSLDLQIGACEIEVVEGMAFSLAYEDLVMRELSYSVRNGELSISYRPDKKWMAGLSTHHPKLTLTIPRGTVFEKARLNIGAAEIDMDGLEAKKLSVTVGAGEMDAKKLIATERADIQVGAGNINIKNAELANVELNCGVGEISIAGELTGKCLAKCGVGEIDVAISGKTQEEYAGNLKCGLGSVQFGDIKISGSGNRSYGGSADNGFDVDCGVGEVNVSFR